MALSSESAFIDHIPMRCLATAILLSNRDRSLIERAMMYEAPSRTRPIRPTPYSDSVACSANLFDPVIKNYTRHCDETETVVLRNLQNALRNRQVATCQ